MAGEGEDVVVREVDLVALVASLFLSLEWKDYLDGDSIGVSSRDESSSTPRFGVGSLAKSTLPHRPLLLLLLCLLCFTQLPFSLISDLYSSTVHTLHVHAAHAALPPLSQAPSSLCSTPHRRHL